MQDGIGMTGAPRVDDRVRGFLSTAEGEALYSLAAEALTLGPCVEVGSYCGRSTIYLAAAAKLHDSIVYAIDHHQGSEEQQPGEAFHDSELYDAELGRLDSFGEFRRNIRRFGLEPWVMPMVATSARAAVYWNTRLGMVFIDGAHTLAAVLADYRAFMPHLKPGGILALHDVYPDERDGGRAPWRVWRMALASGLFDELPLCGSLAALRRI